MKEIEEVISTKSNLIDFVRFFKLERAPENIPSVSVLIASLYRNLTLSNESEKSTNIKAQDLYQKSYQSKPIGQLFSNKELVSLFTSSLAVPTSSGQDKKEKFFLTPFVPSMASYGIAARNTGNPWDPGAFFLEILANYSKTEEDFIEITKDLFNSLKVGESEDAWAIIVKEEFCAINEKLGTQVNEDYIKEPFQVIYNRGKRKNIVCESELAERSIKDLKTILRLKGGLTRQKWLGVFEAYLRLTLFNHIIYTLNLSRTYLDLVQKKLQSADTFINDDYSEFLNQNSTKSSYMMNLSTQRSKYIEQNVRKYCYYNVILDAVLTKYLGERFTDFENKDDFLNVSNQLLSKIRSSGQNLDTFIKDFKSENEEMLESISSTNPNLLKNIKECLEYLCQRKVTSKLDSSPDVNYMFDRPKHAGNSPYTFDLSPGMISTLTCLMFSTLDVSDTFMSGREFIDRLKFYRINLSIKDISMGKIKNTMLSLGIIIDSPDTEGGVLILRPGWI